MPQYNRGDNRLTVLHVSQPVDGGVARVVTDLVRHQTEAGMRVYVACPPGGVLSGTVTATLTTLGPDSTFILGMSLGTWNGTTCQVVLANDRATQGSFIVGGVSSFGNLCVRMYDIGNITPTEPYTYEITVTHP